MKKLFLILLLININFQINAQVTLIPVMFFEQYLVNLGYDTDGVVNGQIATSDALTVEEINFLENYPGPVNDLTGLNDFINLEVFKLGFNEVTSIDFYNLSNVKSMYVDTYQLATFDVMPLVSLE